MPKGKAKDSAEKSNSFAALEAVGDDEAVNSAAVKREERAASSGGASVSSQDGAVGPTSSGGHVRLKNPLIWIDLEMTGLEVDKDTIIEVACIATDGELKHEIQGPSTAIHHSEAVLAGMNDWCKEHHGKSGLTQRVRDSKVSLEQAEEQVLQFIQEHTDEGMAQLAGNSVHVDRMFLLRYMPRVAAYLSYRIVDVSSVKEIARRWFPKEYSKAPRKALKHTALSDIKESIAELKYYKQAVFKPPRK